MGRLFGPPLGADHGVWSREVGEPLRAWGVRLLEGPLSPLLTSAGLVDACFERYVRLWMSRGRGVCMDERLMGELKLHSEAMSGDLSHSPLIQIREKELEIRGRVMEAQKEAEQIVSEARARAAKIVEEASQRAEREAQSAFDKGQADIAGEVEKLVKSQQRETESMIQEARGRLELAVQRVIEATIP